MKRTARLFLLPVALLIAAVAQSDSSVDERELEEARLQQIFADGMASVVTDMNAGSLGRLVQAIDRDDMLERILHLRLIDGRLQRDFREDMQDNFQRFIESIYQLEFKDGIDAKLLLVDSRGDRGRAVVRFDMPHFQVSYIEYELRLDGRERLVVVDWKNFLQGYRFSDRVGLSLIQAQPNRNAVRKLIDFPSVRELQVFQVMEVLKAARDYDFDRFFEIFDALDDSLKRQRAVLLAGLDATRTARKRRQQRRILVEIARFHPQDELFALSLLDYYFPARQYDKALEVLTRTRDRLGIDDGITRARLSSARLVMGDVTDAVELADAAVTLEPDLELGWWAVLRARVAAGDFDAAVPALDRLERDFGHTLDPEALSKDPGLARFVGSQAYGDWYAARDGG